MKLFANKEKTQPIEDVNFGRCEAGEKKQIVIYLFNDTNYKNENSKIICQDKNVIVIKQPPDLIKPGEVVSAILEWSPPLNLKKALVTQIRVDTSEIIEPE